jgi:hypothetical protein
MIFTLNLERIIKSKSSSLQPLHVSTFRSPFFKFIFSCETPMPLSVFYLNFLSIFLKVITITLIYAHIDQQFPKSAIYCTFLLVSKLYFAIHPDHSTNILTASLQNFIIDFQIGNKLGPYQ